MFFVMAGPASSILFGQTSVANQFNPINSSAPGAHLYGISVFSGYYSAGVPYGNGLPVTINPSAEPSYDVSLGAVATFGWNRSNQTTSFSATYSPTYFGSIHHSEYNTLNHRFSLSWSKKLTSKWTLGMSAAGITANMEQLLFTPTTLNVVSSIPTTFDDLTSAILAGKFTDTQLASLLTGTPLVTSPGQSFLYGQRTLNGSFETSFSYEASGRSSFNFGAFGARMQQLRNPGNSDTPGASSGYLIPQTTSAGARLGWSFSLTPRTQISIATLSTRMFSRLEDGYGVSTNFSIGRTLSRRWFVQATGGAGTLTYVRRALPDQGTVQYLAGGSVGFKTYSQTFMATYSRSLGDAYGLGSGSTGSGTGSWTWKHPGSRWSVFSGFVYQRLANSVFQNPISWQANAGIARTMSSRMFMNVQYSYLKFPYLTAAGTNVSQTGPNFSQNAVVVSFTWSPSEYR